MTESSKKPKAIGINHVALEVGGIDEALAFYGEIVDFTLRSRGEKMAFIDLGDQFIALAAGRSQGADTGRHFGLVVDDVEAVRERLHDMNVETFGSGLEFMDPWGDHIQIVEYSSIQFTKAEHVLRGMELAELGKTPEAIHELTRKGMTP